MDDTTGTPPNDTTTPPTPTGSAEGKPAAPAAGDTPAALPGNVIPITRNKRKPPRLKGGDLAAVYRRVLDQEQFPWPDSPRRFDVVVDSKGARTFIEISPAGVCHYVLKDAVVGELVRYSIKDLVSFDSGGELALTSDAADKIAKQWAATRPGFDLSRVKPVREKGEQGLCWQRLPFDLAKGPTPAFDELFSKASNVTAVKQWIGSLFDPDSPRQQYCYLYGSGGDGKSSLLDFLRRAFGPSYKSEIAPGRFGPSQFWTCGLLGMRVVAFDDFTQASFLQDGLFKGLTGGGSLRTEEKGGRTADGEFICKIIITSNCEPKIERVVSDMRRIIYSRFEPRKVVYTESFKDRLWSEGAAFLWACREAYNAMPYKAWIETETAEVENILDSDEDDMTGIFDKYFEVSEGSTVAAGVVRELLKEGAQMRDDREFGRFARYLDNRHGIVKKILKQGGRKFYVGIAIREDVKRSMAATIERAF